ncbi:MAG: cadherin-like domain-containing protein, partial [Betaproteobacteria bacterium]
MLHRPRQHRGSSNVAQAGAPHAALLRPAHHCFALEPRQMFDGAAAAEAAAAALAMPGTDADDRAPVTATARPEPAAAEHTSAETGGPTPASALQQPAPTDASALTQPPVRLAFVDGSLPSAATLATGFNAGTTVVMLESGRDPWQQMSDALALAGAGTVAVIDLVSHGDHDTLIIDGRAYGATELAARTSLLQGWRGHLTAGADLLLYGCKVGADGTASPLLALLAATTGADVAASTDATATHARGGNTVLEVATGPIQAPPAALEGLDGPLAATAITDANAATIRTTFEDTEIAVSGLGITDSDAPASLSLQVVTTGGTARVTTLTGLTFTSGANASASFTIRGTLANVNAALATLRYTPALDQNSSTTGFAPQIALTASDLSNGGSGSLTVSNFAVVPLNDPPNLSTRVALAVNEGGSATFGLAQLAASANQLDPDIGTGQQVLAQQMMVITSLPAQGTLTYNNGAVAIGSVIPVTSLSGLRYTHDGTDIVAIQTVDFGVVVNDGGGGSTSATLSINIAPVNVAPSISGTPTLLESQVKLVAPAIALGDAADTPANATIFIDNIFTGGQGSLFLDANGNNVIDAGEALTGGVSLTATQRANLSTWLKFAHNGAEPNAPGAIAPSFRITVTDAGGGTGVPSAPVAATITLAVTPNNDDPTLANAHSTPATPLTVGEGTKLNPITTAMLQVSDADRDLADLTQTTPANRLVYTIGTRPTQGELQIFVGGGLGPEADGWVVLGDGGRFTQAQIDAGEVRYYQTTNVPDGAATVDSFTFSVRDTALGFDVWTDPANPVPGREGGLRDTDTGPIATRAFHFSIAPLPAVDTPRPGTSHTGAPRPPTQGFGGSTITYSFVPTAGMLSGNSPALWNEGNIGTADGGYRLTSAMLSYQITWTDDGGTSNPADDVSVVVPPAETIYTLTSVPPNGILQRLVGANWEAVADYSQFTQADIDAGRIRFVHNGGEDHVASFGYRVSDGTPNSYSANFNIDMTPFNDRPVAAGGGAVVTEGSGNTVRLGTAAVGMSDADGSLDGKPGEGSPDFLWFRLDSLPAHGTVQRWNGAAWVAATTTEWLPGALLSATVDGAVSGLRYLHDGSEPLAYAGGPQVTFSFVVRDDLAPPGTLFVTDATTPADTSGSAQSNQSAPGTVTVVVVPVNNPPQIADTPGAADPTLGGPVITGGGALIAVNETIANVTEGTTVTIGAAYLTAIDPDHTTVQRQYRIMGAPALGTLQLGGKPLGVGSTFTQADIDANLLSYRHAGAEVASALTTDTLGSYHDKFHFVVSDGVSEDSGAGAPNYVTALITLTAANDKPTVAAPGTLDVLAIGSAAVPVGGVSVADVDLNVIIAGEEDFIRVEVAVLTDLNTPVAGAELNFTAADPTASARSLVTGKNTNALVLQGTRAQVNAALATLTVAFTTDEDSPSHRIRVTADDRLYDNTGTLTGGANGGATNSDGSAINATNNRVSRDIVLRASNTNDAPTIVNTSSYSVNEDVLLTLSGFTLSDTDSFDGTVVVKVELFSDSGRTMLATADTQGALTYTGLTNVTATGTGTNTVTLSGTLANVQAALNTIRFDNAPDYNGTGVGDGKLYLRTTFTDFGHADVPAGNTITVDNEITIVPVNDAPVLGVPGNTALSSGSFLDFNSGFSVQDTKDVAQGANDQIAVTVAATVGGLASGAISIRTPGTATIGGDGTATVTVSGTAAAVQAALNSLRYTPVVANLNATVLMTVTADDRTAGAGNGAEGVGVDGFNTASGSFTINVSAFNDPPTSTAPADLVVAEDSTNNAVLGVSFSDSDDFGGNLRVTLTVTHGTVNLTTRTGLTVVAGNYATSTVTVSGTEANLNAGLASLRYTPTANYHGNDTLTFTVNDQGLTGEGVPGVSTSTVAVTVTPVNDRPTASGTTLAATAEDTADPAGAALSSINFNYSDATDNQSPNGGNTATALGGYAIVGNAATAAQGQWQYNTGGGWINVPTTASDSQAVVLPASAS